MPETGSRFRSPYDRPILRLAVPAFGTLVAEPLYVLVDTAVVGNIGTTELAGLGLASAVLLFAHSVMIFLAYGATGPIARMIASGSEQEAATRGVQGLWLGGLLGLLSVALLAVLGTPTLKLLNAQGEVLEAAQLYLFVSLAGFPFLLLALAGGGVQHGRQDTRGPFVIALASALANLVIEVILVFGFGYGLGASALSTVIAQMGAGVAYVWVVRGWSRSLGASFAPMWSQMSEILRSGGALVVRTVTLRGAFVIAAAIAAGLGEAELAAHHIGLQIWGTLALALDAVAIAGQALTGRYLGEGDAQVARAASARMIQIDVLAGVFFGAMIALLRTPLGSVFTDDAAVLSLTGLVLLHLAAQQPLNGVVFALDGILIGAGDLVFLAQWMVIAAASFGVAAAVVVFTGAGLGWLWGALWVFMLVRAASVFARWQSGRWLQATGARNGTRGLTDSLLETRPVSCPGSRECSGISGALGSLGPVR